MKVESPKGSKTLSNKQSTVTHQSSKANLLPAIFYLWDIQNCAVPKGMSAYDVVRHIRKATNQNCREVGFYCFDNIARMSPQLRKELSRARVDIKDVPSAKGGAADMLLHQELLRFTLSNEKAEIVLISGDVDFAQTIHDLVKEGRYTVTLIHNSQARKELKNNASNAILFDSILPMAPSESVSEDVHCMDCGKGFKSTQARDAHQKATGHSQMSDVTCMQCMKKFANQQARTQHQQSTGHTQKRSAQSSAKGTFKDESEAKEQGKVASQEQSKSFPCKQCGKKFNDAEALQQHATAVGHETKSASKPTDSTISEMPKTVLDKPLKTNSEVTEVAWPTTSDSEDEIDLEEQIVKKLSFGEVQSGTAIFQVRNLYYFDLDGSHSRDTAVLLTSSYASGIRVSMNKLPAWFASDLREESRIQVKDREEYICRLPPKVGRYFIAVIGNSVVPTSFEVVVTEAPTITLQESNELCTWKVCKNRVDSPCWTIGEDVQGEALFTARVHYNDSIQIGKSGQHLHTIHIPYGGKEISVNDTYETLVEAAGCHFVPVLGPGIPYNAIPAGKEKSGELLYIGRGLVQAPAPYFFGPSKQIMCPGKVCNDGLCVSFGGSEVILTNYEILVKKPL